jgi:hypothetical protein
MEAASPNSIHLPGSALLVRGGKMFRPDLEISAEQHFRRFGHYALSFWSVPGKTAEQIAEQIGTEDLPHGTLRACPVERLRRLGYEVMFSGRPWHVSVILPSPPSDRDWDNLEQAFDPPQPNPVARRR